MFTFAGSTFNEHGFLYYFNPKIIKLLKPTKTMLINMFKVKKKRFSLFFNFALWAEKIKFTLKQKQKQTKRLLFDIFSENFI